MLAENRIDNLDYIKNTFLNDENFKQNKINNSFFVDNSINEILCRFCNVNSNCDILIDYRYFKLLVKNIMDNPDYIFEYIINVINLVLTKKDTFTLHIWLQSFSFNDLDKYFPLIVSFTDNLKKAFADKLDKCYFYKSPFVFSQLLSIFSKLFDKKTMSKLQNIV